MTHRISEMADKFIWRVKTLDMDTPGVLVAACGVKEVLTKGKFQFDEIKINK